MEEHDRCQENAKYVYAFLIKYMQLKRYVLDPYGSTESTRIDGEGVSALVTWDSKVTTAVALMGGVVDLVRDRMKSDGIYKEFLEITEVSAILETLGCFSDRLLSVNMFESLAMT